MRVVAYLRISSLKQTSINEQRAIVKDYITDNGYELHSIITDEGVSGLVTDREGYKKVVQLVKNKEIDAVIGWELSRIGRGIVNTLTLLKLCDDNGVALIGVKDGCDSRTASGKLQLRLLSVIYETEAETIARRLEDGRRARKSLGKVYNGRLAYGMKRGKRSERDGDELIKDEKEMKIVRWIKNMKSRGHSYYSVAKKLNERGTATKEGGRWQSNTINRVMKFHYG